MLALSIFNLAPLKLSGFGMSKNLPLQKTKDLMAALLGMKPKHHEDMKLGKRKKMKRKNAPKSK
jgi:hypothetical protein